MQQYFGKFTENGFDDLETVEEMDENDLVERTISSPCPCLRACEPASCLGSECARICPHCAHLNSTRCADVGIDKKGHVMKLMKHIAQLKARFSLQPSVLSHSHSRMRGTLT